MFLLTLFLFILPQNSAAGNYDYAIKTAAIAASKQSGLESNFFKVTAASNKAAAKWARENGLAIPLTVISFAVPIIYKKQIKLRSGDFTFKANSSRVTLNWQMQF